LKEGKKGKKPVLLHKPSSETLAQNRQLQEQFAQLTIAEMLEFLKIKIKINENNQKKKNCEGK